MEQCENVDIRQSYESTDSLGAFAKILSSDPGVCSTVDHSPPVTTFMFLTEWDYIWRLQISIVLLFLTTVWAHRLVLPETPGWRRFIAAIPAVATFIAAPFFFNPFTEPLTTMTITFMSVRMPATKLLAACWGRGPLSVLPLAAPKPANAANPAISASASQQQSGEHQAQPLAHDGAPSSTVSANGKHTPSSGCRGVPALPLVTFFTLCPVVPRDTHSNPPSPRGDSQQPHQPQQPSTPSRQDSFAAPAASTSPASLRRAHSNAYRANGDRSRLLRELAGKWLAFAAATAAAKVLYDRSATAAMLLPLYGKMALHVALAYGMLAVVGGLMDCMALYCVWAWGVDLVPPFHDPFRATSLADFWGHRWNVTQSRVLKGLLYDPIVEGRLVAADQHPASQDPERQELEEKERADHTRECTSIAAEAVPGDAGDGGAAAASTASHIGSASGGVLASCHTSSSSLLAAGCGEYAPSGPLRDCPGGEGFCGAEERQEQQLADANANGSNEGVPNARSDPRVAARNVRTRKAKSAADAAAYGQDCDSPEAPATPVSGPGSGPSSSHGAPAAASMLLMAAALPHLAAERSRRRVLHAAGRAVRAAAALRRRLAGWLRSHRVRRALALLAVFVFSGIEHEVFHWYVQRHLSGRWMTFFCVHGALVLAEAAARRALRSLAAAAHQCRSSQHAHCHSHGNDTTHGSHASSCHPKQQHGIQSQHAAAAPPAAAAAAASAAASTRGAAAAAAAARWLLGLPAWPCRLLTLGVLEATAALWFFEVLLEPRLVGRTVGAVRELLPAGAGWMVGWLGASS